MVTVKLVPQENENTGEWGYKIEHRNGVSSPDWMEPTTSPQGLAHDIVEHIFSFSTHREEYSDTIEELIALGTMWFVRGNTGTLSGYYSGEHVLAHEIASMLTEVHNIEHNVPRINYTKYDEAITYLTNEIWAEISRVIDTELREWERINRRKLKKLVRQCLTKGYCMGKKVYSNWNRAYNIFNAIESELDNYSGIVQSTAWSSDYTNKVSEYSPILFLTYNTHNCYDVHLTARYLTYEDW